ncbi:hypothetical protein Pmar_PMAR018254, partial [Perkinsus marinus ATCC 50983]
VVVSPTLVKGICEVPADQEGYSAALEELSSKIAAFKADGGRLKSQITDVNSLPPISYDNEQCRTQGELGNRPGVQVHWPPGRAHGPLVAA